VSPSRFIRNPNTFPPAWHPKHLNVWRSGLTVNEGVFSSWNGQSADEVPADGFKLR
jgi:hypothetical protein